MKDYSLGKDQQRDYLLDLNTKSDEEIREIIHHMYSKYNQRISKKTFKNALYKVRKIEYLNRCVEKNENARIRDCKEIEKIIQLAKEEENY